MSVTREIALTALQRILDPCSIAIGSAIDICAMGLVEEIAVDAGHVRVVLCLTDPGCVHFRSLERYITDALLALDGVERVTVTHTTSTLWTLDRIERARDGARS